MMEKEVVRFIGNVEALLSGLPEKPELLRYFEVINKFSLTEKTNEYYEIHVRLNGKSDHYFYVSATDIEKYPPIVR